MTQLARRTITTAKRLRTELAAVRRDDVAEIVDELEDGLTSIAGAVRDADGILVAMVGISGPTARLGSARRPALRREIHEAAQQIERRLR
jgi:DNA-binding IclR family transcriptional regulator